MIALGHLPAWLHVATCDQHSHVGLVQDAASEATTCSHGCHHHGDDRRVVTDDCVPCEDSQPVHDHDSDSCALCQSLASPVGFVLVLEQPLALEYLGEPVFPCADRLPVEASIAIPQPRGPPVVA